MRSKLFIALFVVMFRGCRVRRSADSGAAAHAGACCSGRTGPRLRSRPWLLNRRRPRADEGAPTNHGPRADRA